MEVAHTFQSLEERRQSYIAGRPNYDQGPKVMPDDRVKHATGRQGIVHAIRPNKRVLVRWLDENGNRTGRRSTVGLRMLRLVERSTAWKEVAA